MHNSAFDLLLSLQNNEEQVVHKKMAELQAIYEQIRKFLTEFE